MRKLYNALQKLFLDIVCTYSQRPPPMKLSFLLLCLMQVVNNTNKNLPLCDLRENPYFCYSTINIFQVQFFPLYYII